MESRAGHKGFGTVAAVAAFALIMCLGLTTNARAACPSSFTPKPAGARWSPGAVERQAMAHPTLIQAAFESAYHDEPVVGLWKVDFIVDGQVIDQAFDAWHADGTETLNDSVSPLAGNVCLGVWARTGHRTYKLKHPSWSYDAMGNLAGMVVINEVITVNKSGNGFRGKATFDVFDNNGVLVAQGAGDVVGHRITPD